MKNLRFSAGKFPNDFKLDIETNLFVELDYLNISHSNIISFFMMDCASKKIVGLIHFDIRKQIACSIPEAPFGGLVLSSQIHEDDLSMFIDYIETELEIREIFNIQIKMIADGLNCNDINLREFFGTRGYDIHESINHHIEVTDASLSNSFHKMNKRKLKKAQDLEFEFLKLANTELENIYEFIKNCRNERGIKMSMTFDQLDTVFRAFPHRYLIFAVKYDNRVIAATIAVVINDRILYNFYPANSIKDKLHSPMVFLIHELYDYCETEKFEILDLGISTHINEVQVSLANFKERVGGMVSAKYSYSKKLVSGKPL